MDAASETVVNVEGNGGTSTIAKPATTSAAKVAPNTAKVAGGVTPAKSAVATKATPALGSRPASSAKPTVAGAPKSTGLGSPKPAGTAASKPVGAITNKPTAAVTKPAVASNAKVEVSDAAKTVTTSPSKIATGDATKTEVATGAKPAAAKPETAPATTPKPVSATTTPKGTTNNVKKPEAKPSTGTTNGQSRASRRSNNKQRRKAFDAYGRICQIPVKSRTENERVTFEWAKKIVKEALGGDMTKYKLSQYTQKQKILPNISGPIVGSGMGRAAGPLQGNNKRKQAISQGSKLPLKKNRYDASMGYMRDDDAQYGTEIVKQLLTTLITSSCAFNDDSCYNNTGSGMNDPSMNMDNGNYNCGPMDNGLYNGPYNNYGANGSYGGGRSDMNSNNGNFNNFPPQYTNANNNSSFNNGFSNASQSYNNNSRQNPNFSNSQPSNNSYNTNNRSSMVLDMNAGGVRPSLAGGGAGPGVDQGSGNSNNQLVLAVIDRSDKNYCISPSKWKAVEVKLTNVFLNVLREYPGTPPVCRDGGWHQGRIKLIVCADKRSAILYRMAVSRLGELWRNAKLEAVPWNEDSDRPIVNCFLPSQPRDPTSILQIIKTSNPNLSTGNWRIEKLEEPKGDSQFATISVDQKSLESLEKFNFLINYGFSYIKLKANRKYDQQRSSGNMNTPNKYNNGDGMNNFNRSNSSLSAISNRQYDNRNSYGRGTGKNYAY